MNGFHAFYSSPASADEIQDADSPGRFQKGPAFGSVGRASSLPHAESSQAGSVRHKTETTTAVSFRDWPMYRCEMQRSGLARSPLPANLQRRWTVPLGGKLTPPVIAAGRLYVARTDAHLLNCLDAQSGERVWTFTTGGPIDTPPAATDNALLFGCRDGWVYCLRPEDGALAWQFRAAPGPRLVVDEDRLESARPVHGAVVPHNGLVYCLAGRSSFLDGGLYLYALDIDTGRLVHQTRIDGPWQTMEAMKQPVIDQKVARDKSIDDRFQRSQRSTNLQGHATGYDMEGTRADILVSDGQSIWLPQIRLDMELNIAPTPRETWDGNRRLGAHLMATSGLLDDSMFHRTCWLYSQYWPGFASGMAAPNAGNLLCFDASLSVAAKMFPQGGRYPNHRLCAGTTLVADELSNQWWEKDGQRMYAVSNGLQRHRSPLWETSLPIIPRAMLMAPLEDADGTGKIVLIAGPPDELPEDDPFAAWEGRRGAKLFAVSAADGKVLSKTNLPHPPVWDGMAAAGGQLFVAQVNGALVCLGAARHSE
jgi:outer membrane protein assembly factor BamB